MNTKRSIVAVFLFILLFASQASAQAIITPIVNYVTPLLFVFFSGVILAIGFQLFLSVLSIASGVSLIGNLERRPRPLSGSTEPSSPQDQEASVIRRVTTGMGLWSIVTVTLSLFFATVLSIRLSLLAGDGWIGTSLGLVIWAAFFIIVVYFETKSVSSLLGGIASTALAGFRSGVEGMTSLFKDQTTAIGDVAQPASTALREELNFQPLEGDLKTKLKGIIRKSRPKSFDERKLRTHFIDVLDETPLRHSLGSSDSSLNRQLVEEMAAGLSRFSKKDVREIGDAFEAALRLVHRRSDFGTPPSQEIRLSPWEALEDYLRHARRDELNPARMASDLNKLFNKTRVRTSDLPQRLGPINHDRLVAVLEARRDVNPTRADQIARDAETAVRDILTQISSGRVAAPGGGTESDEDIAKSRIKDVLEHIERSPFDEGVLLNEIERILHRPGSTPELIRQRAQQIDRASLTSWLEKDEQISREDVNTIVENAEILRTELLGALERMERRIHAKTDEAKALALHQAELLREAAAASAWWLVAAAAISGVASALGGLIAVRS